MNLKSINIVFYLVFATLMSFTACDEREARSQVTQKITDSNTNFSKEKVIGNLENAAFKEIRNVPKAVETNNDDKQSPFVGIIILEQKLKKENITRQERLEIKKQLKWGDDCDIDNDPYFVNENQASMIFHNLENKRYLIEVMCQSGAYNFGYLFYYYDEGGSSPKANLMKFTWDSSPTNNQRSIQNVSYNPRGSATFIDKDKKLNIFFKSAGHAGCGYDNTFAFSNGKPILVEAKANWDCANPIDSDRWRKQKM